MGGDAEKNPIPIFLEKKPYFTSSAKTNNFTVKKQKNIRKKRQEVIRQV
jgi:hypothetical protein